VERDRFEQARKVLGIDGPTLRAARLEAFDIVGAL
jgi:hypothetical protein